MGTIRAGGVMPPKQEGRRTLSVRDPLVERLVQGLGVEGESLEHLRRFCKHLTRERNRWSVAHRSGLFGVRTLKKDDAERALRLALQSSGGGAA